MAKPRTPHGPPQVRIDYVFDRLHDSKLAQAYGVLVPVRERPVGGSIKEFDHEDGSDLRTSLVGSTARGEHDSESDGIADRIRPERTIWKCQKSGFSKMTAIVERFSSVRDLSA